MELREESLAVPQEVNDVTPNENVPAEAVAEAVPQVAVEEEVVVAEAEAPEADSEPAAPLTKAGVIEAARELSEADPAEISADRVSRLKQQFYMLHNEELHRQRDEFIAGGGDENAFSPLPDPDEDTLKELLNVIKEKKAAYRAAVEAQKLANLEKKRAIIDKIAAMSADTDNVHRHFQEVKDLQTEFKEVGDVPEPEAADIWKKFTETVEHYYDQHKINKELRDYDFKKNLAEKQLLCMVAEQLTAEEDVITAFKRLQELHDKWRETGPVAKEIREELWQRFKDASAVINKRYQAHFEERKARERENEAAKTAICERVEALDFSGLKSYSEWDAMTKEIMQAQEDWKKIGFASKKMNNELFARFRAVCDKFFGAKSDFFKAMKENLAANLEKKTALCEKAEALKDSTDWREATEQFVELQKEWKTIGAVAKKHSDAVWKRFLAACDYFFEKKKEATSGTRKAEQANLKLKRDIIARLGAITDEMPREDAIKELKALQAEWQSVGHVPFRDKDKIYDQYRQLTDALADRLDIRRTRERMNRFTDSVNKMAENPDDNGLYREREKLLRAYETRRAELNTFENNLGFFNSKSKTGEKMLQDMQRKIENLKEDLENLRKKIELIDSKL